jgi:hypothetical protein
MNFLPGEQLGFFVRMQDLYGFETAILRELNYGQNGRHDPAQINRSRSKRLCADIVMSSMLS